MRILSKNTFIINQSKTQVKTFVRIILYLLLIILLVGCNGSAANLELNETIVEITQETIILVNETEINPTATATEIVQEALNSSTAAELLEIAVKNLQNAESYQIDMHVSGSTRITKPDGEEIIRYSETINKFDVIQFPSWKVHDERGFRYDPQNELTIIDIYAYHEDGKYYYFYVEDSVNSDLVEINPIRLDRITNQISQTLIDYYEYAVFDSELDGEAVFILDHPEWYKLGGAIGFADLGILDMQEDGDEAVESYVLDVYKGVKTFRFTIHVSIDDQSISKVVEDDKEFRQSVISEVQQAIIMEGGNPEELAKYEFTGDGAEYIFSNYNNVEDFEIPEH